MSITRKWGRVALALVWVAVLASGCVGGGATTTPGWTALAADNELVVGVLPAGLVVALDPQANGAELWSYPVASQSTSSSPFSCFSPRTSTDAKPFEAVYGQPVLTEDLVILGSYDKSVYALARDAAVSSTARVKWSFATEGAVLGGLTLYDGVVYFGSTDDKVYALNAADGSVAWSTPFETGNEIWSAPVVDESFVYIGSMDKHVYALNRASGALVWSTEVGGGVAAAVTVADGMVFAASLDRVLYALRASDGGIAWQSDDLGAWLMSQPAAQDGYVYAATLKGELYAFGAQTGEARWPAVALGSAVRAGLTWTGAEGTGQLMAVTELGKLVGIDVEKGTLTEVYLVDGSTLADAAVVGDTLYAGTMTGQVLAVTVSESGGARAWVYPAVVSK